LGTADASAAPRPADKDPCLAAASEQALQSCRKKQFDDSTRELNGIYEKLHRQYSKSEPSLATALEQAQNAWLSYRDLECKVRTFESSSGSGYEAYKLDCLAKLNALRITDLKALVSAP
jgi:uncharacterized protein YecT (DUF1311 family)